MPVFDSLLNNAFSISRPARMSDGMGGWTISYVAVGDVEGRMRPASSAERESARQQQREVTHVLYVRVAANIQRGDRVTGGGVTVDVLAVREPSLDNHHYSIDCLDIQQG